MQVWLVQCHREITGYVSFHNQRPLLITLSKLVFTSHCICFYYIMICPVSSAYNLSVVSFAWPRYIGYWLWTGHYSSYLWLCKMCSFSNWWWFIRRKSFLHSKDCFFSSSQNDGEFISYCGYLFPGYLFPALFADQILICFMSATHVSPVLSPLHLRCVGWLWTGHGTGFIVSGTVC